MYKFEKQKDNVEQELKRNSELVKIITDIQQLPEDIILKFIGAAGSLLPADLKGDNKNG